MQILHQKSNYSEWQYISISIRASELFTRLTCGHGSLIHRYALNGSLIRTYALRFCRHAAASQSLIARSHLLTGHAAVA